MQINDPSLTPLMRQYQAIKAQHPDKLLFFRMGDFYELFGEDAVRAAPMLGIALTSRAHGAAERTPLAGVPYHAVDRYLARLTARGEKVVIVEQVEDPKLARGLVKREIVEIITPGTATVEAAEDSGRIACLASVYFKEERNLGLAILYLATGEFMVDEGELGAIAERLRVAEPTEIIFPSPMDREALAKLFGVDRASTQLTPYEEFNFDLVTARRELNQHFGTVTLDSFGVDHARLAVTAAGAILRYLRDNHLGQPGHITRIVRYDDADFMPLDYTTIRNLELVRNTANATEEHSLLAVMNRCNTEAGKRRLKANLLRPFRTKSRIELRQGAITELVRNRELCHAIRQQTRLLPDLERLAGRLGIGKLNPRQMASIGNALSTAAAIRTILEQAHSEHLASLGAAIPETSQVSGRIASALVEEPPLTAVKGNVIRSGYAEALDQLNASIADARRYIGSLQKLERERTGIATLKVGFNQVFGYYLEVTRANAAAVPQEYIRKQTLVNAERYITPELKEKEEAILAAEEKITRLEQEIYQQLVDFLGAHIGNILCTAEIVAEIDVVSALADLAVERGYCRPELHEDSQLHIIAGRHPVIETVLPPGAFIANDIDINVESNRLIVLTGPNMSGKSTYLRQIGLIVIMAQIGSWVPADAAHVGLVDRVFTRVGALDNLARGQSTFLVEMIETANIVHNCTDRSLVLLDEVGRGTSTFDGLSVAWSVVEYLTEQRRPRTVFATHYHELTGMASLYPSIHNYQVAVKKWEDRVVFLHKIIPGGCDDSYGIEVARLAGLPRQTIQRARAVLRLLESGKFSQSELGRSIFMDKVQPTLFETPPSRVEETIRELDMNTITPVQAFDLLRKLKEDLS